MKNTLNKNNIKQWEVWLAEFPFEENHTQTKCRPVVVLSVQPLLFLSVKVTKHEPREYDEYDVKINKWKDAGLDFPSTARISKTHNLTIDKFKKCLGELHIEDRKRILNTFMKYIYNQKECSQAV